jgi:hypothetical protein
MAKKEEQEKGGKDYRPVTRGISVASAIEMTGGAKRGNPYHGPDGRFTTEGGVLDQVDPHYGLELPPGATIELKRDTYSGHKLLPPKLKDTPKGKTAGRKTPM